MYLYLKSLVSSNLSITGDKGKPNLSILAGTTETVLTKDVIGNVVFCDSCASFISSSRLEVRIGSTTGRSLTAAEMESVKNGTLFDLDEDGSVDFAETLVKITISIDLCDAATEWTGVLPGDGTKRFLPKRIIALCTSDDSLNANATIDVGITTSGTEWLNAVALTGINNTDLAIEKTIDVTTTARATVADNATVYVNIASADTGTAGTANITIEGTFLS